MGWGGTKCAVTAAICWHISPALDDSVDYGEISAMNEWQGKLNCSEKTYNSAAFSTTDPT
jgi:hypothetical protein